MGHHREKLDISKGLGEGRRRELGMECLPLGRWLEGEGLAGEESQAQGPGGAAEKMEIGARKEGGMQGGRK